MYSCGAGGQREGEDGRPDSRCTAVGEEDRGRERTVDRTVGVQLWGRRTREGQDGRPESTCTAVEEDGAWGGGGGGGRGGRPESRCILPSAQFVTCSNHTHLVYGRHELRSQAGQNSNF